MKKLILLAVVVLGFAATSLGQNFGVFVGKGLINPPGGISPALAVVGQLDLDFGTITNSATGGTVKMWPAGGIQTGGGVTTLALTGTPATFKVTGANILPTVTIAPLHTALAGIGAFDILPISDCLIEPNGAAAHEYIVKVGGTLTLVAGAQGNLNIPNITVTVNNQ